MRQRIVEPPDIARIFDKPGREWTPDERVRIIEWLNSYPQRIYLLLFAMWHLGKGATLEDAEDAWGQFCVKELDGVINSYDPGNKKGLHFWDYLELCFKRFCWKEGKRIRKRRKHEVQLEPTVETDDGEIIEIEIVDIHRLTPEDALLMKEEAVLMKEKALAVQERLNKLRPKYREVILLYYFAELSVEEIGESLGISSSNVKVRLFRARQKMARCFRKEGITS